MSSIKEINKFIDKIKSYIDFDIEKIQIEEHFLELGEISISITIKNIPNYVYLDLYELDFQKKLLKNNINIPPKTYIYFFEEKDNSFEKRTKENLILKKKTITIKDLKTILSSLDENLEIVLPNEEFGGYYNLNKIIQKKLYYKNNNDKYMLPYQELTEINNIEYDKEKIKNVLIFS